LLLTGIGFTAFYVWLLAIRVKAEILARQARIIRLAAATDSRAA
jgi:hypothetical protein